ncbi:hypothetical protein GCM10007933_23930 [Zoogloea oryzae]|uniref:Uncharacterized protein n=1 Tax=Zoogloea oryzae TaxID=310767 RepID=A0ABQ6FE85_9RHOO|nr:hypothetical protein GCM10007933_23930 [Zoogloea oryzae]
MQGGEQAHAGAVAKFEIHDDEVGSFALEHEQSIDFTVGRADDFDMFDPTEHGCEQVTQYGRIFDQDHPEGCGGLGIHGSVFLSSIRLKRRVAHPPGDAPHPVSSFVV